MLRANSASSSSSSNAVPVASTSSQALFDALTEDQKEYTLKANPQTVDEVTFPQVVSNGKGKATSQRVVGGSFADSLWRLETVSGDDSYRMRERDEVSTSFTFSSLPKLIISSRPHSQAIFDVEGVSDFVSLTTQRFEADPVLSLFSSSFFSSKTDRRFSCVPGTDGLSKYV